MRKLFLATAIIVASLTTSSKALDLKDILGNVNVGDAVSGIVDGLLTQQDITVAQMAGTWTASGSAVCFQSENFLQKAGGSAAAATIESKLNPYYEKYGLTGAVLTVDQEGNFSLKVKGVTLSGTITKATDGNFNFKFAVMGKVTIGTVKAYVEKPMNGLNVMFDASKLKTLLATITKLTGNSLASAAGNILDSYEGLCVGFAFTGSGSNSSSPSSDGNNGNTDNSPVNQVGNALKNLLGK